MIWVNRRHTGHHVSSLAASHISLTGRWNMGQDHNSIYLLLTQLFGIGRNCFSFIKEIITFVVLLQNQTRNFCSNNSDKTNLDSLTVDRYIFNGIRTPTIRYCTRSLIYDIGDDRLLLRSLTWIVVYDIIKLTWGWRLAIENPIKFWKTFIKFMVTKCTIVKAHSIENTDRWLILQETGIGWTGPNHITSLNTKTDTIWISRQKFILCIFQIGRKYCSRSCT